MDFRRFKVIVEGNPRYGREPRSVLAMRGDELEGTFHLLADDKNKLEWVKLRDVQYHGVEE